MHKGDGHKVTHGCYAQGVKHQGQKRWQGGQAVDFFGVNHSASIQGSQCDLAEIPHTQPVITVKVDQHEAESSGSTRVENHFPNLCKLNKLENDPRVRKNWHAKVSFVIAAVGKVMRKLGLLACHR